MSINFVQLRRVLHYNPTTGVFVWRVAIGGKAKAGKVAGGNHSTYWGIQIGKRTYLAHRLAWLYMTGDWPDEDIDHRNRIRTDNRWENIREATPKQNAENLTVRPTLVSGCCGVNLDARTGLWKARITHEGLTRHLGYHQNLHDAVRARKTAEQKYFTHSEAANVSNGRVS
jgi:hypothetical protein